MDNHWTTQQIKNQLEAIVLEAILSVLNKLMNELTAMRKDNEMKF